MRTTKLSVTVFLKHNDEYLFLLRDNNRKVDPNRLNGVGGKVEPGEDYVTAAIRETQEETGLAVSANQVQFAGFAHLYEGYPDDWLVAFFIIPVESKILPIGNHNNEGKLLWLRKNQVLDAPHELVDDLNYVWPKIVNQQLPFFLSAQINQEEKIIEYSLQKIST